MTTNFISRGTDFIRQAVEKDNDEKFDEALGLYTQGISHLMTGLKYEKNQRIVATVKEKVTRYMMRAEEIKEFIENPQPKKKKVKAKAGGRSGGDGEGKDSDGEMDEDTAKMQGALSQAIVMERPDVQWDDVAGLEVAKGLLKEAVILPIKFPHLFTGGRKPWKGILLYGPPGTGKSYLAKAVATEANNSTFFSVSSSDLVSKYVGESERLVRNLFEMARERKPSIIFIDEIDSLAGKRSDGENDSSRRVKTEFLVQMQGVGNDTEGVLVLGATNCPWDLDPAIRRRFQKRIYIPLPDFEGRRAMFLIHTKKADNCLTEDEVDELANQTDGFSGSDIGGVVQDALMEPVRTLQIATHFQQRPDPDNANDYILVPTTVPHGSSPGSNIREMALMEVPDAEQCKVRAEQLGLAHFLRVLESCKPSVGPDDLVRQEEWTQEFGQEG